MKIRRVTVWEMLINPLKSSTKVVLSLSVGPADYLHKRRTICRVSLKHERTTAQLNCDRQVHTYGMTARSCGITDMHAAKIHYCKFSKIAIVGRLWGLHYLLKASIGYQRRLCVFGGRGHRLCVFGGICVDMWLTIGTSLVIFAVLTVFWLFLTSGTLSVQSCNVARVSCNITGNMCNIKRNTCSITGNTCNITWYTCNITGNTCDITQNTCNVTENTCNITRLYQQCINCQNSQKTVKPAKMTIGVPIVTCLRRVCQIHKAPKAVPQKLVCSPPYP